MHCLFWSMKSNKTWGFWNANYEDLYPWQKAKFQYIGLNGIKINPTRCGIPGLKRGHVVDSEEEDKRFICKDCGNQVFLDMGDLNRHLRSQRHKDRAAGKLEFHCGLCNRNFKTASRLLRHEREAKVHQDMLAARGEEVQPWVPTKGKSVKPRCQRCVKRHHACDRQQHCGRCKDDGIPAEECIH